MELTKRKTTTARFPKKYYPRFCLAEQAAFLRGKEGVDCSEQKTRALQTQTNSRAAPEGCEHGKPTSNTPSKWLYSHIKATLAHLHLGRFLAGFHLGHLPRARFPTPTGPQWQPRFWCHAAPRRTRFCPFFHLSPDYAGIYSRPWRNSSTFFYRTAAVQLRTWQQEARVSIPTGT